MTGISGAGARRFLIATAVSRYPKCPEWDRPGLVQARESVIDLFTNQLGYQHQTALGLDPTREQLTQQLRAFCKSPERRPDDLLTVYIGAHGEVLDDGGDHVLLTSDTDPDDVEDALPTVELARKMLRGTQVRRLLLLLDTCYSGQGGNELTIAALDRVGQQWGSSSGSGFVVVSSAQPHQQAAVGAFPHLLKHAVETLATAGHGPQKLALGTIVQQMNDHPDRPDHQRIGLSEIGLTGEPPPFLANPRHDTRLTGVDLAIQQAAEWDEVSQRRETEFTTRLLARAMGYSGPEAHGWWFCGRRRAIHDITRWLSTPYGGARNDVAVITGGPGSGKTAVLGLIAALTHTERRRTVPVDGIGLGIGDLPGVESVDVAIYAQSLTDAAVLQGLAAAAKVQATTVGEFIESIGAQERHRPFTVLVDALDEAASPDSLCSRILRPLFDHAEGRIRLLLGTRPYLLDRLGLEPKHAQDRSTVINLDSDDYADTLALHAYTTRNLLDAHPSSPYRRHPDALRPVAAAVAAAAGRSFLVARITAGTLAAAEAVADPDDPAWRAGLPKVPGEAMRSDLARRLGIDAQRAADLLRPLAYAEGQGLPWEDLWAPLATAISARTYTDEDLLWLRRNAGSYVVEATESDRSAYRLYHQALAEHLREGTDFQAVHTAVTETLLARVPYRPDGARDWSRTHPYTRRYLATHAAAAGRLDEIITDPDYLVHADPRGLTPHLHNAHSQPARLAAAVYRTSAFLHREATSERRQILALDAARYRADLLQRPLAARALEGKWMPRWATGSHLSPSLRDTLAGHTGPVQAVACTTVNGRPVALTGSGDHTARLWDLMTGTQIGPALTGHTGPIRSAACSTIDGIPVAVTSSDDSTARIWDLTTGVEIGRLTGHTSPVHAVACTTVNGTPVAVTGSDDRTARLWNLATATQWSMLEPTDHALPIRAVACGTVDGKPVAVITSDRTVVWDLALDAQIGDRFGSDRFPIPAVVCTEVAGVPIVITASQGMATITDLATRRHVGRLLGGHTRAIRALACTTVSGHCVTVSGSDDYTAQVWYGTSAQARVGQSLIGHTLSVNAIACTSVSGATIAVTGSDDKTARVWTLRDPKTGDWDQVGMPLAGHRDIVTAVTCTTFDGRPVVISASQDDTACVWDLATGDQVGERLIGHRSSITALACATVNGKHIALTASRDRTVGVWDLAANRQVGALVGGHSRAVRAIACTTFKGVPVALTGAEDNTVRIWNLNLNRLAGAPLTGHRRSITSLACSTVHGTPVFVTASHDGTLRIWDLTKWNPTDGCQVGPPLSGHDDAVMAVSCTVLNGRAVAVSGSRDGTARIWDLAWGKQLGRALAAYSRPIVAVACTTLDSVPVAVTGADDGTAHLWDLRTHRCIDSIAASGLQTLHVSGEGSLIVGMGSDIAVFRQHKHTS